ncbi:MAG: hypothetical protein OXC53_05615 [Rhodobacteraceae bacterium]|nr:hypothetical protein [Paracoccaceae bacterium]
MAIPGLLYAIPVDIEIDCGASINLRICDNQDKNPGQRQQSRQHN